MGCIVTGGGGEGVGEIAVWDVQHGQLVHMLPKLTQLELDGVLGDFLAGLHVVTMDTSPRHETMILDVFYLSFKNNKFRTMKIYFRT